MKIAVIDFGMGNLFSVENACKLVGLDPVITTEIKTIQDSHGMILPGVGAFGVAMKNLKVLSLTDVIKDVVMAGKPFMGICLGMQLLFSKSEEFGDCDGLNIIPGSVKKFNSSRAKVPQIGWNTIEKRVIDCENNPLSSINDNEFMYFVHSFYVKPEDDTRVLTTTEYGGIDYCSSILKDNVFATQFHPEKSAVQGLKIYENWAQIVKSNL